MNLVIDYIFCIPEKDVANILSIDPNFAICEYLLMSFMVTDLMINQELNKKMPIQLSVSIFLIFFKPIRFVN